MSTDLFGQYFNNPTKSYIYANIACNGESGDEMSFDITGSDGVISNNEDVLSKIDLSGVHVPMTQYTHDMKTINPYSFIYVKGIDQGEAYTTKAFGRLSERTLSIEDWMFKTTMVLHIKFVNEHGMKLIKCIVAAGSEYEEKTFLEAAQDIFDKLNIPINVTCEDDYILFTSTKLAYDFWISHIELWHYLSTYEEVEEEVEDETVEDETVEDEEDINLGFGVNTGRDMSNYDTHPTDTAESINTYRTYLPEQTYQSIYESKYAEMTSTRGISNVFDVDSEYSDDMLDVSTNVVRNVFLFEDLTKYIPNIKYKNGAMKGCLVYAIYPVFNAEDIPDTQRALKIGHLVDRVEEFYTTPHNETTGLPVYARVVRDVVDSYYSQYEFDIFKKWANGYSHITKNDSWIDPGEIPVTPKLDNHDTGWANSHVPHDYMLNLVYKDEKKYDAIGLYGYANYLSKHNGWMTMGQIYLRTTVEDDESTNTRNMIPSFLIYNPNSFPVVIKYMTFV